VKAYNWSWVLPRRKSLLEFFSTKLLEKF